MKHKVEAGLPHNPLVHHGSRSGSSAFVQRNMSYSLNSLNGGYMGDYMRDYYRAY